MVVNCFKQDNILLEVKQYKKQGRIKPAVLPR